MTKSDLKQEMKTIICVPQEQEIRTNYVKYTIDNTSGSDKCRICRENTETSCHIVSQRTPLTYNEYKRYNDNIARMFSTVGTRSVILMEWNKSIASIPVF